MASTARCVHGPSTQSPFYCEFFSRRASLGFSNKSARNPQQTAAYAAREAVVIDDETNKRLFWAINKHVLPFMLGTYFCQTLDKGTMGFASIMGIIPDAGLEGNKFNWVGTVLYMGALVGEYPTNILIQKLPVGKYLAFNVGCWGAVVACSAAANNFPSLMVVRFLLGLFESVVQPAFIVM